ncbi:MFS transporter [Bowdeniella nasicola]|uniref:Putative proline/betaine transporter n=1 Tax=Bowdeniella nasicola TaxID=208480 RepID=A0A1Q5Q2Q8_9ACTO|nr:MFS transporter [Bowdeniella nasicola]OKL53969.1 MFS transporter [Bowdeniella nasicola]
MSGTDRNAEQHSALRKAATASFIGNFVEWFDYATYGYLAVVIGHVFFPQADPVAQRIATFSIFALSFILRPIGAMLWGTWGDKYGRRWALSWSILIMTMATAAISLIPPYATIGIAAPILLLLLRMIQGFSASGEYAGAATFLSEYAPSEKRGMYTSLVPASTATGLLVGSLFITGMYAMLTDAQIESWGWRIPFMLALPLGLVGRYIRTHLEDSPVYREMQEASEEKAKAPAVRVPVTYVFKHHFRELAISFGVATLNAVAFYLVLSYMPTYLTQELGMDEQPAFVAQSIALVVYVGAIFGMGHLSDIVGRRRMLISACFGFIIFTVPLFLMLKTPTFIPVLAVLIVFNVLLTANDGTLATFLAETFPTKVRYTGFALSFNLANAIFGGTAAAISTWLISVTGSTLAPAWYLVGISALAMIGMILTKEWSHQPLRTE